MPRRLVLHIGMHKTGTTAIQSALAGYDDGQTRMARLGGQNHSIPMLTAFAADPTRYHVWVRQGLAADEVLRRRDIFRARLAGEMALERAQLLVSGEEMSLMHAPSVRAMVGTLAPQAGAVDALAWLRPARDYIGSAFQQMVKAGQAVPDLPRPRYRARIEPYLDVLGRGAVHLHLYDPAREGSSVAAFCRAVGLPPQAVPDRTENTALSDDALRLVWALNRSGIATSGSAARLAARSRLIGHLAGRHPGPLRLPAGAVDAGLDPADIDWAQGITGLVLDDGPAIGADAAKALLQDWLQAHDPAALDRLDEDLQIIHRRLPPQATLPQRLATLYQAFLDEVEAEQALAPVFRAGNRVLNAGARDRTRTDTPGG
ncbi:MAG: hypothetical protein RIR62_2484 [Pseudomonadota bacterium]